MTRLSPVSHAELIRRLRELGFEGPFSGGKHLFMLKGDLRLTIPNPHRKEIGTALLSRILRQAAVERDGWIARFG
jgi:predicted RNA binding protein YcfA (HicA-like mRNA interferase family)